MRSMPRFLQFMLVIVAAATPFAAPALAQPTSKPKPSEPTIKIAGGVVSEINLRKRGITFLRPAESIYGTLNVSDYFPLAEKATIAIDGKPSELRKICRDQIVMFLTKNGYAIDVIVTSREEFDRRQKELAKQKEERLAFAASVQANHDKIIKESAAKAFAKDRKEREAAMRAQYAAYIAALDQWRQQRYGSMAPPFSPAPSGLVSRQQTPIGSGSPSMPSYLPGGSMAPAASRPTLSLDERQGMFVGKIVAIGLAHCAKTELSRSNEPVDQLFAAGAGWFRDVAIDSAFEDVAPDLNQYVRRAAARAISKYLDGELTFKDYTIQTIRDEVTEYIAQQNPGAGSLATMSGIVADAIINLQSVRQSR